MEDEHNAELERVRYKAERLAEHLNRAVEIMDGKAGYGSSIEKLVMHVRTARELVIDLQCFLEN